MLHIKKKYNKERLVSLVSDYMRKLEDMIFQIEFELCHDVGAITRMELEDELKKLRKKLKKYNNKK